ncbi:hypothetical protein GPJ56_004472 [Histomonas meleagridis]|uniref:uncharacterized protein n=1 Tax=Histomonas meleagridis TaxID=135588 RepID=UPI0035596D41|nr:hypothetical protein GPJ56_004472 [Histomonas meleagridis]KAH0802000.1 hypothetical protein GO595_005081 [Histomonas meleagridis]
MVKTPEEGGQNKIPTCKVRGNKPEELHLSTRSKKSPKRTERAIDPPQAPPQGELLATEYIHNLQQQLYFLNAELRFLKDRSGINQDGNALSVDASISRLRRACAVHEEKTNQEVKNYELAISDLTDKINSINENKAFKKLDTADSHETEVTTNLENAFLDIGGDIQSTYLQSKFNRLSQTFYDVQSESFLNSISQQNDIKQEEKVQNQRIQTNITELKSTMKKLLCNCMKSIKNNRIQEEHINTIASIAREDEFPTPNIPKSLLDAKNAKVKLELQSTLETRKEIESQVDLLLEKNVKLKSELNIINSQIERAKYYKEETEKKISNKYKEMKGTYNETMNEINALKRNRKEMKNEIEQLKKEFNETLKIIDKEKSDFEMNQQIIEFIKKEKEKVDKKNDKIKNDINDKEEEIEKLKNELHSITLKIAEAGEKQKEISVLVELNNKDPKYKLKKLTPELKQLLESLTAVKEDIMD